MAINYSYLSLASSLLFVVLFSHWVACLWVLQAKLIGPVESWMGAASYCVEADNEDGYECGQPIEIYCGSLYWSFATITSIGYGDIHASLDVTEEIVFSLVLMMSSAMVWAYVIGTFCGVMSSMNPDTIEFRNRMDTLNRFMSQENLPDELRQRLREYFHEGHNLRRTHSSRALINQLSPTLMSEVVLRVNEKWLRPVWFLRDAQEQFMIELALSMTPLLFAPGEMVPPGNLYIVYRGIALCGGKVKGFGKTWGEDAILSRTDLQLAFSARAMNYLEIYACSKEDLLGIASLYPTEHKRIRKFAIFLALRRQIVRLAKRILLEQGEEACRNSKLMRGEKDAGALFRDPKRDAGLVSEHNLALHLISVSPNKPPNALRLEQKPSSPDLEPVAEQDPFEASVKAISNPQIGSSKAMANLAAGKKMLKDHRMNEGGSAGVKSIEDMAALATDMRAMMARMEAVLERVEPALASLGPAKPAPSSPPHRLPPSMAPPG